MSNSLSSRAMAWLLVLASSLLTNACGGGDAASVANVDSQPSSNSSVIPAANASIPIHSNAAARAKALATAIDTTELIRNAQFIHGATSWAFDDASMTSSEVRSGGKAVYVGWRLTQYFHDDELIPGRSYTLRANVRNTTSVGKGTVMMRFRLASGAEIYRTYQAAVKLTTFKERVIEFTAPPYTNGAELVIEANGSGLVVDSVSLKMREGLVRTEPVMSSEGSYVPAGYRLTFNDEFNGTALNRAKWFTRYIYQEGRTDRLHDEKQRYRDNDNHRVSGGVLSLVARKVSDYDPDGINYESGMIRSDWTQRYGFYEARVKMPSAVGLWSAFWLNSDASAHGVLSWPPEIDIFEMVNNGVEDRTNMLHSNVRVSAGTSSVLTYLDPRFDRTWTFYQAPFDFSDDWHTVGCEWTPTSVSMFVDGKKIYTRTYLWHYVDGVTAGQAHILLNLAVGGEWAGRHGIDELSLPQSLKIDWVRAYQKQS